MSNVNKLWDRRQRPPEIDVWTIGDYWPSYYFDTGCKYHDKCQSCPYPKCFEDMSQAEKIAFHWDWVKGNNGHDKDA